MSDNEALREKFFYDLTYLNESNVPDINCMPHHVWEWIVNHILNPANKWQEFDFLHMNKRPKVPGKYFICRKDGKVHWETWNGSGWAYNHNEVRYFMIINPPIK